LRSVYYFFKSLFFIFSKDKKLFQSLRNLLGFYPRNILVYELAFAHRSAAKETAQGYRMSNERLEFLGDAVLGAVVADLLFKKFPYRDEGFLTEMRSRIVSRESLKHIAFKMGIDKLVQNADTYNSRSIYGDALEALIGAVYIDRGYKTAQQFILQRIIYIHVDLQEKELNDTNFKSRLINHAQKEKHELSFDLVEENQNTKQFTIRVLYNGDEISRAIDYSKKRAEQNAAAEACKKLDL
jgi:ribonuclease III